jgi:hypothetical protein
MDSNGQPDSKRPRIVGPVPGPPPPWNHPRDLPQPQPQLTPSSIFHYQQHGPPYARQPEPQPNPLDAHRRHSAQTEHRPFDHDSRRPNSGPSHAYHQPTTQPPTHLPPYGGQQDVTMKRDSVENAYRPASTGSAPDPNIAHTHPEARYPPHLPPFETAQHPRTQSYQGGPPHVPHVPHSPMPGNEAYGPPGYPTQGPPPVAPAEFKPREEYVSYPAHQNQKRKAQRAAQACDSCRTLKAKCDEGRPLCSTCKDKGFPCVYRDPPPKPYVSNL